MDKGSRWEINAPHVVAETIDGEVVAISMDTGSYYSIRGSGAVLWSLLAAGRSVSEIEETLHSQFDAEPSVLAVETSRFVSELLNEALLRPRTNDGASDLDGAQVGEKALDFAPPLLEKFTDMEDLLLLDPIHDVDAQGWPHTQPTAEH